MTGAQLVVVPFLVLVLPVVAALAWWLKRRYTAAVVHLQADRRSSDNPPEDCGTASGSDSRLADALPPQLHLHMRPACEITSRIESDDRVTSPRRVRRRVLFLHLASELSYWCALALGIVGSIAGSNALAVAALVWRPLLPFVLVPAAVAWILQAGLQRTLMSIASAVVVVSGIGLLWSDAGWGSELGFALGFASITVMVSAFLRPSVRGAGLPLVAAGVAGWLVLSVLFAIALTLDDSPDETATSFAGVAVGVIALLLMLGAAVWCGWRTLMGLAARYAAKRFSDVQLALGTYWAILTVFMIGSVLRDPVFVFGSARPKWIAVGIVALWLLWRWLQSMALQRVIRTAGPSIGALLLLRVFKPSGRSQAFTDRFFSYWRFAAPVWMIAGPDLAGAYLEPNEFFDYLRGRLREHFVADPDEAAKRVEALDSLRDPDGRFRVNEVCCTADTWRPTVLEMMARAGVILLDLREYSERRRGTRYELAEVLRRAPLKKVLVLVNANDDVTRLRAEIDSIWRDVGRTRRDVGDAMDLFLLQFRRGSNAEMRGLFRATVEAATGGSR